MRIETINPLSDPSWDDFLVRQPEATIFHSAGWARVIHDTYGFEPRYIVARDDNNEISAAIPLARVGGRRLVGLPFSDFCPPLLANAANAHLMGAVKSTVAADGIASVELRGGLEIDLQSADFVKGPTLLHHVIPLDTNLESISKRVHLSARRAVAKAKREGVTVRVGETMEDMRAFYQLNVKTRKKLGLIPQPWRFFASIHRHLVSEGSGYLLLAQHGGRITAGELLLGFNGMLIEKASASDERFLELRPNHLLKWASVELGVSGGYRAFDLGRCEPHHEGLRRFKQLWGGDELPFHYYYYPKIQSGTPLPGEAILLRRLMGLAVRVSPLWALRQAGTLLYKGLA